MVLAHGLLHHLHFGQNVRQARARRFRRRRRARVEPEGRPDQRLEFSGEIAQHLFPVPSLQRMDVGTRSHQRHPGSRAGRMHIVADPLRELRHAVAQEIQPLLSQRRRRTRRQHPRQNFLPRVFPARPRREFLQVQRTVAEHPARAVIVQAEIIVNPENVRLGSRPAAQHLRHLLAIDRILRARRTRRRMPCVIHHELFPLVDGPHVRAGSGRPQQLLEIQLEPETLRPDARGHRLPHPVDPHLLARHIHRQRIIRRPERVHKKLHAVDA